MSHPLPESRPGILAGVSVSVQTGSTVPFDRFWRWLKHHANCILRAGTPELWIYDQEDFHWHLEEDAERNPVIQIFSGKNLVAELALDIREVMFVQATPEAAEGGEPGQFLFELVDGSDPSPVYHFLLAHGFEEEEKHGALKH
jgi:hypothetical protein